MEDDERFKHLVSDPRFKNLRKKKTKIQIDDRFKSMFTDERFTLKYSRDKRGRKDKKSSGDNLKKYYSLEEKDIENQSDDKDEGQQVEDQDQKESHESEGEENESVQGDEETVNSFDEEEESEIEENSEESESELSSSSDEASDEDEDELDHREIAYDWQPLDHDAEKTDQATRRIAIQNIDWDHFEIRDIYALVNSIRPPMNVKIYVSEFGKERLAKESVEGPQELIEAEKEEEEEKEFKDLEAKMKALQDKNSLIRTYKNNEYEDADECIDPRDEELREKIRQYQLSRMKYYYAIVEFDSVESAEVVYKELDGMEYEGSSLELDLRFVPDEMEFDEADLKSECNQMSDLSSYKAPQFINTALQQTSVKFTWDETDVRRQEKLSKAYTKAELEKDDLEAYLGSDTDSEDGQELDSENGDAVSVVTGNSEARINKYKMLLQSLDEEDKKKKKIDVDVVWGDYDEEDAAANGSDTDQRASKSLDYDDQSLSQPPDDEESEEDEEHESEMVSRSKQINKNKKRDKSKDKKGKKAKRKEREKADDNDNDDDLDLLMMDSNARTNEEFKFNPDDARFKAVYESGLYNIDPSHPNFKRTEAINQIAEKKRQKRQKTTTSS